MSFVEATTNVIVGYLLAVLTQIVAFPMFGLAVSVADNLLIGHPLHSRVDRADLALRRLFEAIRAGG